MATTFERVKNFVQTGACLYKENWCSGGHVGGKREFDKEPCKFYDGKRCTHPKNPKNVKLGKRIVKGDM